MATEQLIKQTLEKELPGAKAEISRDPDSEKVGGRVIWAGFQGGTARQRQERIFRPLRRQITPAQAREISFIFSYTPYEYEQMQAE